ncbi:MAG: hypothetical protein BGO59_03525 [Spirosoma sp. 48-14]|nr:MAG: hypothetical protein BGO59_03525 [Spirosoma sp. 48-14]
MLMLFCGLIIQDAFSQSGNFVPSGGEAVNYGTISLGTSTAWSTARTATPGYFAASGTATYTNASDANNINGYVKHYVKAANQGFTFPVGSGTDLRTLTTSGAIPNGISLATAWIVGDPSGNLDPTAPNAGAHNIASLGSGITAVSSVGQWDWIDNNAGGGVTVTVSIPDVSGFANSAARLRLVGWNGSQWVNLSGNTGASGVTENSTLSGTMIPGITAIGIGLGLPVGAGTIDCTQTKFQPAPVQGTPSQTVLVTTINVTSPGTFTLALAGSGMSLASGVTSLSASQTGLQTFYIPVNYDGTTALTSSTLTAGAGSCVVSLAPATGTIDCSQTQLSPAPVQGTPGQTVLIVTVNVTTAGTFPVTVSGSGMSLSNGVTSVSTTTTGTQKLYILLNYDGSTLGTLNFTIGSAGSCSANLTSAPKQTVSNVWTLACVPTVGPALK